MHFENSSDSLNRYTYTYKTWKKKDNKDKQHYEKQHYEVTQKAEFYLTE